MHSKHGKSETLRIASYNVRKCMGTDRRRDPDRVLTVIDRVGADLIALQEADRRLGRRPTALPPERIGHHLELAPVPVPGASIGIGHHGNAILARPGLVRQEARPLDLPGLEPRGAILADFRVGKEQLRVAAAHLGLRRRDRKLQVGTLCEAVAEDGLPTVILGDLNEWRRRDDPLPLPEGFRLLRPGPSFHSRARFAALDGIILGPGVEARSWGVFDEPLARRASDHLPIWADIALPREVSFRAASEGRQLPEPAAR